MSNTPNPEDFSVNEKPREYEIRLDVRGTIRMTIEADSLEEAKTRAHEKAYELADDALGIELDEVEEVAVGMVYKSPKMYRVMRDGRAMQVSRLEPGDAPREPIAHNF